MQEYPTGHCVPLNWPSEFRVKLDPTGNAPPAQAQHIITKVVCIEAWNTSIAGMWEVSR